MPDVLARGLTLASVVLLLALAGCDQRGRPGAPPAAANAADADHAAAFLARHWQRPLAANGPTPAHFSPAEASLAPSACGTCHVRQLEDWRSALHSRAMGPGLMGQLQAMGAQARDEHQACLECHAPLAEQADHLVKWLATDGASPAGADEVSSLHGLTCAGCHVRQHQRLGPPRQDGSTPVPGLALPHDGWQSSGAFSDSRFCAACHQFTDDGPSLNGKPLENTFAEWQASRHAREGRSCQSCHMPQRRHLWRGIHDPEMVKSGLRIDTTPATVAGGRVGAALSITNTGVGHAFPSYVTPRVEIEIAQADRRGKTLAGTLERYQIVRDVSLDLTVEHADTRLLPDEQRRYNYDRPRDPRTASVLFRITVYPDAFYAKFYRATLRDPQLGRGRAALREALRRAEHSHFEIFSGQQALPELSAASVKPRS